MQLATMAKILRQGRFSMLTGVQRRAAQVYGVQFLASASSSAVLRLLAEGPLEVQGLMDALGVPRAAEEAFRAWLGIGEALGELRVGKGGVVLAGRWARGFADPANDDLAAIVEQLAAFGHVAQAVELLARGGRIPTPAADGARIARASRVAERPSWKRSSSAPCRATARSACSRLAAAPARTCATRPRATRSSCWSVSSATPPWPRTRVPHGARGPRRTRYQCSLATSGSSRSTLPSTSSPSTMPSTTSPSPRAWCSSRGSAPCFARAALPGEAYFAFTATTPVAATSEEHA
jgi:hypothetical protein